MAPFHVAHHRKDFGGLERTLPLAIRMNKPFRHAYLLFELLDGGALHFTDRFSGCQLHRPFERPGGRTPTAMH